MSAERRPETDDVTCEVLGRDRQEQVPCRCRRSWSRAPRWRRRRPTARPRWRASGPARSSRRSRGRPRCTPPRVSTATSAVATRSTRGRCKDTPERHTPGKARGRVGRRLSPTFVTRAKVDGRGNSYIAVVPDKDCIVNKGDHSPAGGTNAATVYTTPEKSRLTNPTERNLYPQVRDARGGNRCAASVWTPRWTASPMRSSARWTGGALVDRAVGDDPARDELRDHQALLRPVPEGSLQQGAGPRRRCRGACATDNRPERKLRTPEHRAAHSRSTAHCWTPTARPRTGRHDPAVRGQQLRHRHGALQSACSRGPTRRS